MRSTPELSKIVKEEFEVPQSQSGPSSSRDWSYWSTPFLQEQATNARFSSLRTQSPGNYIWGPQENLRLSLLWIGQCLNMALGGIEKLISGSLSPELPTYG